MKKFLLNHGRLLGLCGMLTCFSSPAIAQVPSDLMRNCSQWKITYPDGVEDKTLCNEANNEYYYVNSAGNAITFHVPIRSSNGSTPNSDYIRSELRERTEDGSADIYWTTSGSHMVYSKQAITHLPTVKPHLVATQIHGNKADGIDDSMVMRLEGSHLFLSFNGGKLRDNVTIKTNYVLGTVHEVIFLVVDGKHYCYYSEDGNLLTRYNNGTAAAYLVKDGSNDYVMNLNYDQSYFKIGNYTQSNPEKEGSETDKASNYGEVLVYDFIAQHGTVAPAIIAVTGVAMTPTTSTLTVGGTQQLSATISPSNATNKTVTYSSNNTSVATVSSSGLVTAVATGSATITAKTTDGAYTANTTITVAVPTSTTNLALNKSVTATGTADGSNVAANLVDGSTSSRWSVSGFPQSATIDLGASYNIGSTKLVCYSDRAYQYSIAVATTANGTYTTVVNRSSNTTAGTASSPIADAFSSISGRFVKITVTGAANYTGSWVSLTELSVYAGSTPTTVAVTGLAMTPSTVSLNTGATTQLTATVSPSNASNQAVTYSSSNTAVATVSTTGLVTAKAAGTATITAKSTDGSFTKTSTVTVTAVSTTVSNLALNKSVTYSSQQSSNPASNLVDGDLDSRWSAENYPVWVMVDLGGTYVINSTAVVCHGDRAYKYTIEASTNGTTFTQVVNRANNTTSGTNSAPITDTFSGVSARYVRMTVTGAADYSGSWASIDELKVFGYGYTAKPGDNSKATVSDSEEALSLWPNPATNTVNINGANGFDTLTVYDVSGKTVINQALQTDAVDISTLKSGFYIFSLSGENGTVNKRIIKK